MIILRIITNILQLIKYQWSLPEEVLTPDTLCIPNTIKVNQDVLLYMYSTYHQIPGNLLHISKLLLATKH